MITVTSAYTPINTLQEHHLLTVLSLQISGRGTLACMMTQETHQTSSFLSFNLMGIFCTHTQMNFKLWVATFSQIPKLLCLCIYFLSGLDGKVYKALQCVVCMVDL